MNLPVLVVGAVFVGVGLAVAFLGEHGAGGVMVGAGITWISMWVREMLMTEPPSEQP